MRVLFTDHRDGTLFVADVSFSLYSPNSHRLTFDHSRDRIIVPGISPTTAKYITSTLFRYGMIDLSKYKAYINEEPYDTEPDSPSPAPPQTETNA